jgi:hypothetical protein
MSKNNYCSITTLLAVNQDHKKNNHEQKKPEFILGKPFSIKGKTQQSFAYIVERRSTIHHQTLAHKRVPYN